MKRTIAISAVAVALLPALAGCAFGACPAIAYLYAVDVQTSGEFASLEVCADGDCVGSADGTGVESPAPDGGFPPFELERDSGGVWAVSSLQSAPERLTVRAYDDAGTLLAEESYDLEWTRTGGSEQCGGPMETPALDFAG